MRTPRKVLSIFMAVVLAVGLCPGVALAGDLVSTGITTTDGVTDGVETTTVDASDAILQAGGFNQEATAAVLAASSESSANGELATQAATNVAGFEAALSKAASAWDGTSAKATVDVKSYGVTMSNVKDLYASFFNRHGEFFYLSGAFEVQSAGSRIVSFVMHFNTSYKKSDLTAFSSAVNGALKGIESGWNNEQKALYLHDWLATHCEYDKTLSKRTAYDALVGGKAVCQGYTLAYDYLMSRAGVECDTISSEVLNHTWNLVTISGKTYYVDCTWDDAENVLYEAYCGHEYFLRSKSAFGHDVNRDNGKSATDWVDTSGANVYGNSSIASSTTYDKAYWSDAITAIPHVGNLWAYVDSKADGKTVTVYVHDYATGKNRALATSIPGAWSVWKSQSLAGSDATWSSHYTSLVSNGEAFLASTPTSAVKINASTGAKETVYELTSTETKKGNIYGLTYDDSTGMCRYELGTEIGKAPTGSGTFAFPNYSMKTSIANAKIKLSKYKFTYSGKVQKPTVKTVAGKTLKAGTDYTVHYSNAKSTKAGSYTVWAVGKGNYTGTSAKATYKIAKQKNPVKVKAKSPSVSYAKVVNAKQVIAAKKAFTIKNNKGGKYRFKKISGDKMVTVAKNGKVTVAKGTKEGTHVVKVKVSFGAKGSYAAATRTVTLKVTVK